MPGLINRHTLDCMPLQASRVSACINGYSLGITASLTYKNDQDHLVEGMFIFPVPRLSTVVDMEAQLYGRTITVQVKDRADYYYLEGEESCGHSRVSQGKFTISEHENPKIFHVNVGTIPPYAVATILLSISSEVDTDSNGVLQIQLPPVFTPRYHPDQAAAAAASTKSTTATGSGSGYQFGSIERLTEVAEYPCVNKTKYEFDFQLEVKEPRLLAGVESPTHAVRVDADPYAQDASSIYVTLAEPHNYKSSCLKLRVHVADPHEPAILLENGDMNSEEYEKYIAGDLEDYIATISGSEEQVQIHEILRSFLTNRMHKDMMHNPVVMLNFCPDFDSLEKNLSCRFDAPGEYVFMIDRSGSMSGVNIANAREALMLFLKSLPLTCQFNIISYGSSFSSLFKSSKPFNQNTVEEASEYIRKMTADMGCSDLCKPLEWVFKLPTMRGCPRHLFVLTDGGSANGDEIIELVRCNAHHTRVYTFGIGENVSPKLISGMALAGRGDSHFIPTDSRIQGRVISSLRKALQPSLTDITVEWTLPCGVEIMQSPINVTTIVRGERLAIYGLLCDTLELHDRLVNLVDTEQPPIKFSPRTSTSNENSFYEEAEENYQHEEAKESSLGRLKRSGNFDLQKKSLSLEENYRADDEGGEDEDDDLDIDQRRASSNPETEREIETTLLRQLLEKLTREKLMNEDVKEEEIPKSLLRAVEVNEAGKWRSKPRPSLDLGLSPMSPEWDDYMEDNDSSGSDEDPTFVGDLAWDGKKVIDCNERVGGSMANIKGLFCGRPFVCEVPFDLASVLNSSIVDYELQDFWDETIHQLAAKSLIHDLEVMARQAVLAQGSGSSSNSSNEATQASKDAAKFQRKVVETSEATNVISKHTVFTSVNSETNETIPSFVQIRSNLNSPARTRKSAWRKSKYTPGLGRRIDNSFESDEEGGVSGYPNESFDSAYSTAHAAYSPNDELNVLRDVLAESFLEASSQQSSANTSPTRKKKPSFLASRLDILRGRLLQGPSKKPIYTNFNMDRSLSSEVTDINTLVATQHACGSWKLNEQFADVIEAPLDRLQDASPLCSVTSPTFFNFKQQIKICVEEASEEDEASTAALLLSPPRRMHPQLPPANWTVPLVRQSKVDDQEQGSESAGTVTTTGSAASGSSDSKKSSELLSTCSSQEGSGGGQDSRQDSLDTEIENLGRNSLPGTLRSTGSSPESDKFDFTRPESDKFDFARGFWQELSLPEQGEYPPTSPSPRDIFRAKLNNSVNRAFEEDLWATALALAWLEQRCSNFFQEWELVAGKADRWLSEQPLPKGFDVTSLKASAGQVLHLLKGKL